MNKQIIYLIFLVLISSTYALELCTSENDYTNCSFITPAITCDEYNYTIINSTGNLVEEGNLTWFYDNIYYFNMTLPPGEYIIRLCDGTTRIISAELNVTPPNSPNVYNPTNIVYHNIITINYTDVTTYYPINYYNISLYYPNNTFVKIIKSDNTGLGYLWNSNEVSNGLYKIKVQACDTYGQCSLNYSKNFTVANTQQVYNSTMFSQNVNESNLLNVTLNLTPAYDVDSVWMVYNSTNYLFTDLVHNETYQILLSVVGLTGLQTYSIEYNDTLGNIYHELDGNFTVYNGFITLITPSNNLVPYWENITVSVNVTDFVSGDPVNGANVTLYLNSSDDFATIKLTEYNDLYKVILRFTNKTTYDYRFTAQHSLYYDLNGYFDINDLCRIKVKLYKDLNKSDPYINNFGYIFFSYEPPTVSERAMQRNEWAYTMLINFKEWGDSVVNFSSSKQYRFKTKVYHAEYEDGLADITLPCGEWAFYFVSGDWQFNPNIDYDWAYVAEEYSRSLYLPRTNLNITESVQYDFYVTQADLYPDEVFWKNVLIWGGLALLIFGFIAIIVITGNASLAINFVVAMIVLIIMIYGISWLFWFKW